MSNIIDLNVFKLKTLDFKLPDEEVLLHILKPTREQVIALAALQTLDKDNYTAEAEKQVSDMVLSILNSNNDDRMFDSQYVENELNDQMIVAIISAYSAWITGIEADPN